MSDHTHSDGDEHDDATHSITPLVGVDATDLHAAVASLTAALHAYVDTAVGVRAEFGAREADEDPRILSLEAEIGALNASLYDALHSRLGLHSDLTAMSWGDEDEGDADAAPVEPDVETYHIGFVVTRGASAGDRTLDSVLDVVEAGGAEIAQAVVDSGFDVHEWGVSRGGPVVFDEDADEEQISDSHVQVVRGAPDDHELAALVAGLISRSADVVDDDPVVHSAWTDRGRAVRGSAAWGAGGDAWRWSLRG